MASEWKNINDFKRKEFRQMQENDKIRYEKELNE